MQKIWVKLFAAAIAVSMSLSLFACTGEGETESTTGAANESTTTESIAHETEEIETDFTASEKVTDNTEAKADTEVDSTVATTAADADSSEISETSAGESETDEMVEPTQAVTEDETTEYVEPVITEEIETTEKQEEVTYVEKIYGYDFTDSSWSSVFITGGGATREIAVDPAGSGEAVLAISHDSSQTESWVKNNDANAFENTKTGKFTISVDLYIPSTSLQSAGDYVQLQLNGEYNHHCNLVSDDKSSLTPFDTKDFPRDKWFQVQFIIDMDSQRYNLVVVEDGQERTVIFSGRATSTLNETGPTVLRVYLAGTSQIIYFDHHGVVTERIVSGNEGTPEVEVVSGVSFIRVDGVNAAGEALSIYGDYSGDASANDLTDVTWERCDTYGGTYTALSGASGLTHTPESGGYYVRVKAKYGAKTLTSLPVYIRDEADAGFFQPYLSFDDGVLTAAVVYNNEKEAFKADVKVIVYDGDKAVKTYTDSFTAIKGSEAVFFEFDAADAEGKRVELVVNAGNDTLCKTEDTSDMPLAKLQKKSTGSTIYIGKAILADFKDNRYMRFRATTEKDHWIGTEHNPVDMGFAYQEASVKGLYNTSVEFTAAPGVFKIVFIGQKAGLKADQRNELIGFWNAETEEFSFVYNCSITADTVTWHANSSWAASNRIEAFDYCLERMSILDRVYNNNLNGDLYDYVIYENGDELTRIPKLPVPRTMLSGKYFYGFFVSPGESFYMSDAEEGGWKSTLLSAIGDTYIEICWSWYDIHNCAENSVPRVGNCDKFTVSQSWLYTTTTAAHDSALIEDATEVAWRDLPNYQLPLFSTNNTFETQFGGTEWQYAWWKSSYDCTMDSVVGHSGAGSVKIEKSTTGATSWYTEGVWGFPYSFDQVQGKTYRVSGWIKTENVVGEAYIANIQYQHATPNDNTVTRSEGISGTTDWTYVSFTFTAQEREMANGGIQRCIDHFFLTLDGSGTVWFDDVVIEEVK